MVTVADLNTHVRDNENVLKTSIANDGRINGEIQAFREDIQTLTISAGAITFNVATANNAKVSLTANITAITVSGWTASKATTAVLRLTQDATGGRTVTLPAGWKWDGGTAPTVTATASKATIVTLYSDDGGTTIFASLLVASA